MGIRIFILLLFIGIAQHPINAQRNKQVRCSTPEYNQSLARKNPDRGSASDFEKWMAKRLKEKHNRKANGKKSTGFNSNQVITLPIIFHIIHNGETTGATPNIDAQYINAQLQQLNQDFANLSGSTQNVAADTKVQFCLAQIDPSGNCLAEAGINRINRNNLSFTAPPYDQAYFESQIKPATQWNPNQYYNVWTAELVTGLFGFAQLPEAASLAGVQSGNGSAATDGTVVQYQKIGSKTLPFSSGAPYNMGRTLTHETGHWLGLIHIWGDGPCGIDDFCQDTPRQSFSSAGCPSGVDSCPSDPGNDMYENYMDYSNDICMNTFTADQANRISVVMDAQEGSPRRAILANSNMCGCAPIADFTPAETTIELCSPNQDINFINTSERVYLGTSYNWTFSGAGVSPNSSTLASPTISTSFSGQLSATLTVSNVNGTSSTGPRSFTVTTASSTPGQTGLTAPLHNQIDVSLSPVIEWNTVSGASSYYVEYSTSSNFSAAVFAHYSTTDTLRLHSLVENTQYYWRVFSLNACNTSNPFLGTPSATRSFKTLTLDCQQYSAQNMPMTISSSGKPTVQSTLTVPVGSGPIVDINIIPLNINHSYISDLTVSLTSPAGDASILLTDICKSEDDLFLNFDQDGQAYTDIPCPATDGLAYRALTSFDEFIGTDPTGDWVLTISDAFSGDGGALVGWTLEICTEPVAVCDGSLTVSATASDLSCYDVNDGSVTATVSGGSGPYSYYWETASGTPLSTSSSVTSLSPATYLLTVTDANQCTNTTSAIVQNPAPISINLTKISDVNCAGGTDGALSAALSGGSGGLTYQWSSGQSSLSPSGLPAGVYSITATDANTCISSAAITISEPPSAITMQIVNQQNISCHNENDGSATVNYSGGTAPYQILWSNNQSNQSASGLTPGKHFVTITDNNGCSAIDSVNITQPAALVSNQDTIRHISCYAAQDGTATVAAAGGTAPYSYTWSTTDQTPSVSNLGPGRFYVTITDANNCHAVDSIDIIEPLELKATFSVTEATCQVTDDGAITTMLSGGSAPYYSSWEDNTGAIIATSENIINLAPGIYYITIIDNNNCVLTDSVLVDESFDWIISPYADPETCVGISDGQLYGIATGGSGSYSYLWEDEAGASVNTNDLPAGNYFITCTDMTTGCSLMDSVTLIGLPPLQFISAPYAIDESCFEMDDGSLYAEATGGTSMLIYTWKDSLGNVVSNTGLAPGLYNLEVSDANGNCSIYGSATINAAPYEYTVNQGNMLTGVQTISKDYESSRRIESNQQINGPGLTVDYDADQSILLKAGFEVKAGNVFHAFIDGCGGS